jgi:hypothetical protein
MFKINTVTALGVYVFISIVRVLHTLGVSLILYSLVALNNLTLVLGFHQQLNVT